MHRPSSARPAARPRVDAGLLTTIAGRITGRDRRVIAAVREYRVLTTPQIAARFFPASSLRAATGRLDVLYRLRLLDRAQPHAEHGSAPYHWIIDDAAAHVLAANAGTDVRGIGYRRDTERALLLSSKLAHTIGVNNIATGLHVSVQTMQAAELVWWSEARCAKEWGGRIVPDGYARITSPNQTLDFFLEYDTGSEALRRLAAKIDAYTRLADTTGLHTPVLFALPNPTRERNLTRLIAHATIPVATTVIPPSYQIPDATGPLWHPLTRAPIRAPSRAARRLVELPNVWSRSQAGG